MHRTCACVVSALPVGRSVGPLTLPAGYHTRLAVSASNRSEVVSTSALLCLLCVGVLPRFDRIDAVGVCHRVACATGCCTDTRAHHMRTHADGPGRAGPHTDRQTAVGECVTPAQHTWRRVSLWFIAFISLQLAVVSVCVLFLSASTPAWLSLQSLRGVHEAGISLSVSPSLCVRCLSVCGVCIGLSSTYYVSVSVAEAEGVGVR